METLYLSGGKALSTGAGKILFGPCRCGYCLPTATLSADLSIGPGGSTNVQGVDSLSEARFYDHDAGAWDSMATRGISGRSATTPLPGYLRRTPCAIIPETGGSARTASAWASGAGGPSVAAEFLGVQRDGRATHFKLGWILHSFNYADYTEFRDMNLSVYIPDGCAQYLGEYGTLVLNDSTEPSAIPADHSFTAIPSFRTTRMERITVAFPGTADPDMTSFVTRAVWARVSIWIDPQYDQGLIGQ